VDPTAPFSEPTGSTDAQEFLVAFIGGKQFALPVDTVREILQMVEPMPMPAWKRSAIGMIDLRGELIPLMDVSTALGVETRRLAATQLIVILSTGAAPWGLVADQVEGVSSAVVRNADHWNPHTLRSRALYRGLLQLASGPAVVVEPEALLAVLQQEVE